MKQKKFSITIHKREAAPQPVGGTFTINWGGFSVTLPHDASEAQVDLTIKGLVIKPKT